MMIFQFSFMLLALGLCLMLSGVLSVFGYHVVRRGVIFVDLSLAQVAALGSSIGILLGYGEEHPLANFWLSLVFTLVGAILFSLFRRQSKAPVEALIGVTYAGAMALSLLVLEKSATGTEALKEMLIGSIITVSPHQVMWVAALCIASLFFLGFAGKRLLLITENPIEAKSKGIRIGLWDFLFYMTFGIVVTLAVKLTGVLLVFAFLIVPSLAAVFIASTARSRILFGWIFGAVGCLLGLELSLRMDSSAGPTVVTVFLLLLLLTGGYSALRTHRSRLSEANIKV